MVAAITNRCLWKAKVVMIMSKKKKRASRRAPASARAGAVNQPTAATTAQVQSLTQKMDNLSRRLPKGTFATVGGAVGRQFGGPIGATVGGLAGRALAAITGRGDYTVRNNTIYGSGLSSSDHLGVVDSLPQFRKGAHTISVAHREYFADLLVPADPSSFNNLALVVSPSNGSLFPWLASMSKQYQMYRIKGMVVEYKSNTSDFAANGPLGVVGIATNYNVADAKWSTLVAFENSEFAVVTKPSRNILHALECAPQSGRDEWLYVRDVGNEESTFVQDQRFCDFAKLQICTSGLPGIPGQTLGQLWVSYDIEFTKPVIPSTTAPQPTQVANVVTSNSDGTIAIQPTSRTQYASTVQNVAWTALSLTPTYNVFGGVSTWTGDTGFALANLGIDGTKINIKRPGTYRFTTTIKGTAGSGTSTLAIGNDTTADFQIELVGTASGMVYSPGGNVAHAGSTTGVGGYKCVLTCRVEVLSADDVNVVKLTLPRFTVNSSTLITASTSTLDVEWVSYDSANVYI